MIELFRQLLERDAALRGHQALGTLKAIHLRNITYYLLLTFALGTAFVLLMFGQAVSIRLPHISDIVVGTSLALAAVLVLSVEFLRENDQFLWRATRRISSLRVAFHRRFARDFLARPFWIAVGLIALPSLALLLLIVFSPLSWISPGTEGFQKGSESLRQITALAGALLAAQIALFNFMFGQLLGRYSSVVATSVIRHPVIKLLRWFSLILFGAAYGFSLYGYPSSVLEHSVLIVFAALACLFVTTIVANDALHIERAIQFAGQDFAGRVRRAIHPPIDLAKDNILWRAAMAIGLDWRNAERRVPLVVPARGASVAVNLLTSLVNAANKALQENQREAFLASLDAIGRVADSYSERRALYYGVDDQVFSYLNDQMAMLAGAAAKCPNEHLLTDAIRCIGYLGSLSTRIGRQPRTPERGEAGTVRENHQPSQLWIGLLTECFGKSYTLQRTTAASEAIIQLGRITTEALRVGYPGAVRFSYLPNVQQIHRSCLLSPDAYRLSLAGECLAQTLRLWRIVLASETKIHGKVEISSDMIETIFGMAREQFKIEKLPSWTFKDVGVTLTSKLAQDQYHLQDIFVAILYQELKKQWEQRAVVDVLGKMIDLTANLATHAIKEEVANADNYSEALYEMAYFILRGLPTQYQPMQSERPMPEGFPREPEPTWQEVLDRKLFDVWKQLFSVFHAADVHVGLEWRHHFFGIVGLGMVIYKEQGREWLREILTDCVRSYLKLIREKRGATDHRLADDDWDYLQLVGAWTVGFLKDEVLGQEIATEAASGRPFRFEHF